MERPLYRELARAIQAKQNCKASGNTEWLHKWSATIKTLMARMPSGTGLVDAESHAKKLVFSAGFRHVDDNGFYDGWTEHTVTVTGSLRDTVKMRISGPNRNNIKDDLHATFHEALTQDVTYWLYVERFPEYRITSKWENEDGSVSQCHQAWYVSGGLDGTQPMRFWNRWHDAIRFASRLINAKLSQR